MKKLIAYSSVSHMGFVTLGIFTNIMLVGRNDLNGFNGSMMVMLAHGFNTGALFLMVGMLYERAHTRLIAAYGGIAGRLPVYTFFFGFFTFASIALPGTSGFIGEFLVIAGYVPVQQVGGCDCLPGGDLLGLVHALDVPAGDQGTGVR